MSSSGLIYAVIVGAWAAYLVPMWLRRQDELNEARPTERFSTAIRLLSGKAAMERRYAREARRREADVLDARREFADADAQVPDAGSGPGGDEADGSGPDTAENTVDVRAFADPKTMVGGADAEAPTEILAPSASPAPSVSGADGAASAHRVSASVPAPASGSGPASGDRQSGTGAGAARAGGHDGRDGHGGHGAESHRYDRQPQQNRANKRAKVLARRRRTTMLLFLAFTVGSVVAAVGGLGFLWAPAAPAVLLTAYIVHLRVQERRRFAATMDRRRAEAAAQRLREREQRQQPDTACGEERQPAAEAGTGGRVRGDGHGYGHPAAGGGTVAGAGAGGGRGGTDARTAAAGAPARSGGEESPGAADRRVLVEQTDHAEWVDQQRARDREPSEGEGWEPVPVPLPTYVSAPVAPRATRGVDLDAADTWSSARSSSVGDQEAARPQAPQTPEVPESPEAAAPRPRRSRERNRTPLFDQFEDGDRPRAANE